MKSIKTTKELITGLAFMALAGLFVVYLGFISLVFLYILIVLIAAAIVFLLTGGRAWFGTHEHPERILGALVKFEEVDLIWELPPKLPDAVIRAFENGCYRADFVAHLEIENIKETYVDLRPRHEGYPISRVTRRGKSVVSGKLESGRIFLATLYKV